MYIPLGPECMDINNVIKPYIKYCITVDTKTGCEAMNTYSDDERKNWETIHIEKYKKPLPPEKNGLNEPQILLL